MSDTATVEAEPIETRVRRGAELLDKVRPGWWREIAADQLAMHTCGECILGQLYGGYSAGFWELTRFLPAGRQYAATEYGFTLLEQEQELGSPRYMSPIWCELAAAWRAEIAARAAGEMMT